MKNETAQAEPTTSIVRIDKRTGDVRLSNLAEVERIVHLNYHHPDQTMDLFNAGNFRVESPFAFYEIRHEEPAAAEKKEAA